jgi:hypothetical protein
LHLNVFDQPAQDVLFGNLIWPNDSTEWIDECHNMVQCSKCPHIIVEGKTRCIYCGAVLEGHGNDAASSPTNRAESLQELDIGALLLAGAEASLRLYSRPSRRRTPMRRPILFLAFLAAFAFGGLFVWLLM